MIFSLKNYDNIFNKYDSKTSEKITKFFSILVEISKKVLEETVDKIDFHFFNYLGNFDLFCSK